MCDDIRSRIGGTQSAGRDKESRRPQAQETHQRPGKAPHRQWSEPGIRPLQETTERRAAEGTTERENRIRPRKTNGRPWVAREQSVHRDDN